MTPESWKSDCDGRTITSIRIGGKIDFLARPRTLEEICRCLEEASALSLPIKIIGGGSNLVFSDEGFRGLLLQPLLTECRVLEAEEAQELSGLAEAASVSPPARYSAEENQSFLRLQHRDEPPPPAQDFAFLLLGAGVPWGMAASFALRQGLDGLQWFARIPCQVGGAVYNNIHGQSHFLSEYIAGVEALDPASGGVRWYAAGQLEFDYDDSRFHRSGEIITRVLLRLPKCTPERTKEINALYLEWTKEKARVQPSGPNCGSVFKNLSREQAAQPGGEAVSAAWYVDRCGWKGRERDGLQVYPGHANFIVNHGEGSQKTFISLVEDIRRSVHERFGFWLEPEVECWDEQGNLIEWQRKTGA